jgi:MoaA/NifB/PqqE/SkfB family radical SAM enzyme
MSLTAAHPGDARRAVAPLVSLALPCQKARGLQGAAMESIYYVLSFACHRKCVHCYEDRFRPYRRDELARLTAEAKRAFPLVIANLPGDMRYLEPDAEAPQGAHERIGRIIVSGGEVLIDPVREEVLYPALALMRAKYAGAGGVRLVVQTTGDLVDDRIIDELLELGVAMISVAGMDDFHVGLEGEKREALRARLVARFEAAGMRASGHRPGETGRRDEAAGPLYSFFGATPGSWIGKLWPRGRAFANGLSSAGIADNFCSRWSGGLNFLNHRQAGSEVAIEPTGDVYPCCLKTRFPLGNLTEEKLIDILDSLTQDPAFAAINRGEPERMGLEHGWTEERFLERSQRLTPKGELYRNLCFGCDAFHEEVLGPRIDELRAARLARRIRPAMPVPAE